jgi:hypothetical protein
MCRRAQINLEMKHAVPLLCGAAIISLIVYLALFYTLSSDYPHAVPSGNMDAHAITAGALQANADLLTTIALALAALFGFSVSSYLTDRNWSRYGGMILTTVFGVSLTFVFVNAYAVYHAIAVQTDLGVFYLDRIDPLINQETWWVIVCAILSVSVFCWRFIKIDNNGGVT